MSATVDLGFDELYALGEMDTFLRKAQEKIARKLQGKTFAGMDKEDVTQEILIKIVRSLDKFDSSVARMSTFVDHIMEKMIIDCYRKCMTEKNLNVVNAVELNVTDNGWEDPEDDSQTPVLNLGVYDVRFDNSEFIIDIMENLGLNEREKEIFKLRSAGYEFREIADILGVSKARVSQIWKGVREKYEAM